jgi:hypothetical protein
VAGQQRGHARLFEPDPDLEASHARLRDLEQRGADAEAVADADLVVGQAGDGEVLAEAAADVQLAPQLLLPVAIGLGLLDEHRAVLAAVADPVRLVVAVDVEPVDVPPISDRLRPDRRAHLAAAPLDRARPPDVHGEQARQ